MKSIHEIGNTPIYEAFALSKMLETGMIYLKLESYNPTGSHKDRVAGINLQKAQAQHKNGITVGTCGSYGLAVAWACSHTNFNCKIFIPQKYRNSKIQKISQYTDDIVFIDGSYEDAIAESQAFAAGNNYYDGNPFNENSETCFDAYGSIANEIMAASPERFDIIWLPVGNGTTLTGLYRGFEKQNYKPGYGAISSSNGSAVLSSMENGKPIQLDKESLQENETNEPLVSWMPPTNIRELIDFRKSASVICKEINDAGLVSAMRMLRESEGIVTPPYSAAGLAGLISEKSRFDSSISHLIILTS